LIACGDNFIYKWDITSNTLNQIGGHSQPVKDVYSVQNPQSYETFVISGGWDARVKFWTWASPN